MPSVTSSNIAAIEYVEADEKAGTQSELIVQFKNGSIYAYKSVPKTIYDAMLEAPSPGKYLNSEVKGRYTYEKKA
jgi:hypothetical protein